MLETHRTYLKAKLEGYILKAKKDYQRVEKLIKDNGKILDAYKTRQKEITETIKELEDLSKFYKD
jgi:hypothetical protein